MSSPATGELAPHRLDHRAGLDNLVLTGSLGLHSFSVLVSKAGAGRMLLILTTRWVQIFTVSLLWPHRGNVLFDIFLCPVVF